MFDLAMPTPRPAIGPSEPVAVGHGVHDEPLALWRVLRGVVARVLGELPGHPDVEDCTHEALRRALEGRDRVHADKPFYPWAIGIARHVALDARRARRRARSRLPVEGDEPAAAIDGLVDPAAPPDDTIDGARRKRALDEAIARLPEGPRRALVLMHVEGLRYAEIAERLGVPLGTVATWLSRGRRALALAMAPEEDDGAAHAGRRS